MKRASLSNYSVPRSLEYEQRPGSASYGARSFSTRIIVIAVLLLGTVTVSFVPVAVLTITALREGNVVYVRRIEPQDTFSLGFMHSVEHCPVWDHIMIDDKYRLVTCATEYWSSRTGLPYAAFGDEVFSVENDHFRISNMHRLLPAINQWVDSQYGNTLRFPDGEEIDLASLAGNTLLQFMSTRMRLFHYFFLKAKLFVTSRGHHG